MSESKDFFQQLRERFSYGLQHDADDRKDAEADGKFANGEQWDTRARRARKKRPCLTEDRLTPSINQVVNEGRKNKPGILAVPMDGGNPQTAEYFEGRIRHIEYECDADEAYDTARRQQVTTGRGWLRVTTREVGKKRKNGRRAQIAAIEPIHNQFSIVWDPDARRYDKSDAKWAFAVRTMSKEHYEDEFGTRTKASGFVLDGAVNPAPAWIGLGGTGTDIQVADYYVREEDEDGESTVCIYVTNGVETLEDTDWIGSTIPLIPVFGEEYVVDGVRRTRSLIRGAKEPQKLVNLYVSNIAEQISQIPKTPYLVAEGQIAGREDEWKMINEVQTAVVQYKRIVGGQDMGVPQRNTAEPPIQAMVQGYLQAVDAVKASMGIYDAALGARSNETSGLAINERQDESDNANFHFLDNEARSRKRLGRILLEIIPQLDGVEPGMKPTRAADGKVTMTPVNREYTHPKTGQRVIHDMNADAEYGVAIKSGPSFDSQREEENQRQAQIIQAVPDLMWVIGDLYFRTSDTPGSEIIADRMERAIQMRSPGLVDAGDDAQKQLSMAKAQLAQTGQQNQALIAEVHKLSGILESKAAENTSRERIAKAENDSKERMKAIDAWATVRAAEIKNKVVTAIADADREGERLESMFDRAHEVGMAAADHVRTLQQGQQAAAVQQQQQAGQQAHEQDMQQQQQDHTADMQDAAAQQQRQIQQDAADQQPQLPKAA